jgi:hypothetical protein
MAPADATRPAGVISLAAVVGGLHPHRHKTSAVVPARQSVERDGIARSYGPVSSLTRCSAARCSAATVAAARSMAR